jgi:hypothetical protein
VRSLAVGAVVIAVVTTGCTASSPAVTPNSAPVRVVPSTSATAPPSSASAPVFDGGVFPLTSRVRRHVRTMNWHPGCPVPIDDLRLVRVSYWNFRGDIRTGPLVLNRRVAADVLWVFRQLFRARFPIHRIDLSPRPQPLDWNSTRNLSSSFNCRDATDSPGSLSEHSYGWAVDIDPLQNPYVRSDGSVLRAAVKPFTDRARQAPGMIRPGDVVVRSFAKIGWGWGGDWTTIKDYMHFSLTGR